MRQRRPFLSLGVTLLVLAACVDRTPTSLPAPRLTPSASKGGGSGGGGGGGGGSVGIAITSASLVGTSLTVTGVSDRANVPISVNGTVLGSSNASGAFTLTSASFTSASCTITVSDGVRSTTAALSPCSPGGAPAGSVPRPVSPAAGASVLQPVTLSWSAATAATPVIAYNWQIATTSGFTTLVLAGSVNAPATQDAFSGLPNGTYWWRVQAVEQGTPASGPIQGGWSTPVSFSVSGSVAGTPAAPTMTFPASGAQYHPYEFFYPRWSAVANAAAYVVEYSLDAGFTPGSSQAGARTTPFTVDTTRWGNPITVWVRARGMSATGVKGVASAPVRVVITYTAPIGPPPTLLSPLGATVAMPITFRWTDVQNPQPEGYTLMIASEPSFRGDCAGVEYCNLLITGPSYTITSDFGFVFKPGTHYWRVQSIQGDRSPTLPALTAWSATGTFVVK